MRQVEPCFHREFRLARRRTLLALPTTKAPSPLREPRWGLADSDNARLQTPNVKPGSRVTRSGGTGHVLQPVLDDHVPLDGTMLEFDGL